MRHFESFQTLCCHLKMIIFQPFSNNVLCMWNFEHKNIIKNGQSGLFASVKKKASGHVMCQSLWFPVSILKVHVQHFRTIYGEFCSFWGSATPKGLTRISTSLEALSHNLNNNSDHHSNSSHVAEWNQSPLIRRVRSKPPPLFQFYSRSMSKYFWIKGANRDEVFKGVKVNNEISTHTEECRMQLLFFNESVSSPGIALGW